MVGRDVQRLHPCSAALANRRGQRVGAGAVVRDHRNADRTQGGGGSPAGGVSISTGASTTGVSGSGSGSV